MRAAKADPLDFSFTVDQHDEAIRLVEYTLSELLKATGACVLDVQRVQEFRLQLVQHRNALLPIHKLPQELLLVIWGQVTYDAASEFHDGTWTLAQVSKAWADVIVTSPGMWCDISSEFSQSRIEKALQKSSERLLYLSLITTDNNLSEKFDMLLPHAPRWKELQLDTWLPEIILTMRVMDFPALEVLEMWPHWDNPSLAEPPNLLTFPKLHTLILHAVPLDWAEPLLPVGIRSLSIIDFEHGPTFSQILALLSSVPFLEELELEEIVFGFQTLPAPESQKPITMPRLRNVRLVQMARAALNTLLVSIQLPQCTRLVASPLDLTTLPRYQRHLHARLTSIAPYTPEIHLNIEETDVGIATLSSHKPSHRHLTPPLNGPPGFFFGFRTQDPSRDIQNAINFIAYTQTPVSMSIDAVSAAINAAVEQIDWDQLPSLQRLDIRSDFSLQPIFAGLSQPRGPRHALRWPCPRLSTLKLI
ncbi:hypothetical protein FRB90_007059, partial [Tulasnella sp. 427]